jgi:hypothetical protein
MLAKALDVLFAPTLPALRPLAQVAVSARHLPMTLVSPRREFIAEDCGICSVLVRDPVRVVRDCAASARRFVNAKSTNAAEKG